MKPVINYIIATYPGKTFSRHNLFISNKYIDTQLFILKHIFEKKKENNIDCFIKRITILVTKDKDHVNDNSKNYYKFEKWKNYFIEYDIEIIFENYEGLNEHHSYDQWLQGMVKSSDVFTHHIIIEDDYCIDPFCYDFDIKLYNIYKEKFKDNIGYLSSKCGECNGHKFHAMISNGLISSETMKKLKNPLELFYNYKGYGQLIFSYLFTDNNIPICDFSDYYKIPFWDSTKTKIIDYTNNKKNTESCIIPFEEILINEKYNLFCPSTIV